MMQFNEITALAQAKYEDLLREAEAERMCRTGRPAFRYSVMALLNYLVSLAR
jgi:hypothetical protein